jgi:hypothetical protein
MPDTKIHGPHAFDLGEGRVLATIIPAGRWNVRVATWPASGGEGPDLHLAWAEGVGGQTGPTSFPIASGHDRDDVIRAASQWQSSATATVSSERVRYVGLDTPGIPTT